MEVECPPGVVVGRSLNLIIYQSHKNVVDFHVTHTDWMPQDVSTVYHMSFIFDFTTKMLTYYLKQKVLWEFFFIAPAVLV